MPIRLSGLEFLVLLVIILVLFGPGRLSRIAGELGRGIREFRKGMKSHAAEPGVDQGEAPGAK
jgi:sec-independent protein translocase protein TatA